MQDNKLGNENHSKYSTASTTASDLKETTLISKQSAVDNRIRGLKSKKLVDKVHASQSLPAFTRRPTATQKRSFDLGKPKYSLPVTSFDVKITHGSINLRQDASKTDESWDDKTDNKATWDVVENTRLAKENVSRQPTDFFKVVMIDQPASWTRDMYNIWAASYNKHMLQYKYSAPDVAAEFIQQTLQVDPDSKILDVGCGTGLLGVALQQKGYRQVSGVDISEEMTHIARKRYCYQNIYLENVTSSGKLAVGPHKYSCIVFCTSIAPGHIPLLALSRFGPLISNEKGSLVIVGPTMDYLARSSDDFQAAQVRSSLQNFCETHNMELVKQTKFDGVRHEESGELFAFVKKSD